MQPQSSPQFDLPSALAAMGNDREIYAEVLETYLESLPALLGKMDGAIASGNRQTVLLCAHTIKSSSYTIGGMRLGAHAEELEHAALSASDAWIQEKAGLVRTSFDDLCAILAAQGLNSPSRSH